MLQSPSSENPKGFAESQEGLLLLLAERISVMKNEMTAMAIRLDRLASEQATREAIVELSGQVKALQIQAEGRIRPLEDWKNRISAQVQISYVFSAAVATIAGIVGRYWKS